MRDLPFLVGALAAGALLACSADEANAPRDASRNDPLVLAFSVDAPANGETYACFGFDASSLAGRWLRTITWTAPAPGAVALHHATLYAVPTDYPDGPVACDTMPASWTMHVWAPGGAPLTLPDGVGMALPSGTRRLVVQAHVLRFLPGAPATASAILTVADVAPEHVATWLPAVGAVPAIRPHMQEHTSTTCRVAAPMHVVTAWPHMHRFGQSFQGAIVRADGTRSVIDAVPSWDFDQQRTYVVERDMAPGDGIETDCTWFNPTDAYVLPGPSTHDEMCGQGLIVWPAKTAAWAGPCD